MVLPTSYTVEYIEHDMMNIDERTLKIIELARSGVGGEKANAQRILRDICRKQGLSYDDIINHTQEECAEHIIEVGRLTKLEVEVAAQVVFRFATTKEYPSLAILRDRHTRRTVGFKVICTPSHAVEAQYAVDVYLRAYRSEMRRIARDSQIAFVMKHNLYPRHEAPIDKSKLTYKERAEIERATMASMQMADVSIYKAIGDGDNE